MKRFLQWWKGQPVLGISLLAALVSMCFVPPDAGYLSYCNRAVLIQLFCLMLTVAGLRSIGVFEQVTQNLLKRAGTVRRVGLFLVQLCFFSAMLVTKDVALLTFVPLTLLLFRDIGDEKSRIQVVVLETAAANLGSMMTPVGNPQNLYLYAAYQLHTGDFFRTMLPAGVLSWLVLLGLSFLLPKTPCAGKPGETTLPVIPKKPAAVYLLLFLVCLLTVFRVIPDWLCLVLTAVLVFLCDKKLFAQADYCLLGTFVCFFVFVGNIARVDAGQGAVGLGGAFTVHQQCAGGCDAVRLYGKCKGAAAGREPGRSGNTYRLSGESDLLSVLQQGGAFPSGKIPGHFLCRELRDAGGPAGSRLATAAVLLGRFPHTPDTGHPADAPAPWSRQGAVRGRR